MMRKRLRANMFSGTDAGLRGRAMAVCKLADSWLDGTTAAIPSVEVGLLFAIMLLLVVIVVVVRAVVAAVPVPVP